MGGLPVIGPRWFDIYWSPMRSVSYRSALTAFIFTGLWFAAGAFVLWTPIPGVLGIGPEMFAVWLVLFLLTLGVSGILLTLAALSAALATPTGPSRRDVASRLEQNAPAWAQRRIRDQRPARRNES